MLKVGILGVRKKVVALTMPKDAIRGALIQMDVVMTLKDV